MYLGFVLFLAGLATVLGTLVPFAGPVVFAAIADRWYIAFEEAALGRKFGQRYEAYRRTGGGSDLACCRCGSRSRVLCR